MTTRELASVLMVLGVVGCGPKATAVDGVDDDAAPGRIDARPGPQEFADAGDDSCVTAVYDAEQQPAALLVLLDRSSSMASNNKWTYAAQAIVQALDQDVFDAVAVGLYAAPTGEVTGPACIFNFPVACMVPPFPQIDLAVGGSDKSSAPSGVRRDIKDWLVGNSPDTGIGDASPLYGAAEAALGTLRGWPVDGKRILLIVTDGSISCAEFSSRPGFGDCNGCVRDWEDPRNIADLLAAANADASKPVESFVIGVPGADTYDPSACNYPPYRMRLALSAIAYAGAPAHVPAECDGTIFTAEGANPSLSCHFDMTTGGYSAEAVAETISYVRGETVGCVYELPEPPPGESLDLDRVNVEYTADGATVELFRRGDPSNPCTSDGCWDYTAETRVELIGKACADVKAASSVQVRILSGCTTIVL